MADIFSRKSDYGGSMAADSASFTFSVDNNSNLGAGLLVQNLGINYNQQVTRLFDITDTAKTYFVAGRTGGQLSMARVIGPKRINAAFVQKFGNVCNIDKNVARISGNAGCGTANTGQPFGLKVSNAVITNYGVSMGAQDMVINEQLGMMFISLEME